MTNGDIYVYIYIYLRIPEILMILQENILDKSQYVTFDTTSSKLKEFEISDMHSKEYSNIEKYIENTCIV